MKGAVLQKLMVSNALETSYKATRNYLVCKYSVILSCLDLFVFIVSFDKQHLEVKKTILDQMLFTSSLLKVGSFHLMTMCHNEDD